MKRRSLLQAGIFLGVWGASSCTRTAQVLAAPTARKLALLVGINQYRNAALNGCLTDIELQKELLIHRFGFQPNDILTLTDQQATRSRIETAFIEHLIRQAQPNDVIVFHFSGFGSLQKLGTTADDIQPILITADEPQDNVIANGISQDTLLLLLRSLPTQQVTTIIDAGYLYPGYPLRGNLKLRSRSSDPATQLIDEEIEFQERLLANTKLDRTRTKVQWRSGQMPGVVLSAADAQQFATESPWNGFSAGLFTYALTQQLWRSMPETTLRVDLRGASELIARQSDAKQQPILIGQKSRERPLKPYQVPITQPSADGVITAIEDNGKIAYLWLGGLPPQVLEAYSLGGLFRTDHSVLQVYERSGLVAKAKAIELPVQVGQPIREAIRTLPKDLSLAIAIDATLNRVERVDAVSAFSGLPRVAAAIAGEQAADYLFSKVEEPTQVASLTTEAMKGTISPAGYGLFSQGREAIPSTAGESGEAVKLAVKRLTPQLQTRLGAKLLSLTANSDSSQLSVRATLVNADAKIAVQQTSRIAEPASDVVPSNGKVLSLPIGTSIQIRLENHDAELIHFLVLGLDNNGTGVVLSPRENEQVKSTIAPGETFTLPQAQSDWIVRLPAGLSEAYVICSRTPFQQTEALVGTREKFIRSLPNFLDVAQAVLQDVHQASSTIPAITPPELFALNVNEWATFRFFYQVV